VVEHFLGKEEVVSSILINGSKGRKRSVAQEIVNRTRWCEMVDLILKAMVDGLGGLLTAIIKIT
jgi:hypothetical protein